jgi:hypothetical protein
MALQSKSLFLYNILLTSSNNKIDFKKVAGPTIITATISPGAYSLTSLAIAITAALNAADNLNVYYCTVDRTVGGGLQNRVTIGTTTGTYFNLMFASGPNFAVSISTLIGFPQTDTTGALFYTGGSSAGTVMQTTFPGYNYLSPDFKQQLFGSVNVSASGLKEAIVYAVQRFLTVEFRYEPKTKCVIEWLPLMTWMIEQKPFDFTPEVSSPSVVYSVTLESTGADSKGLGFEFKEMLPQFPNDYSTQALKFRVIN